jgi:hypothetical protein
MYPRERITEDFEALAEQLVRPGFARHEEATVAPVAGARAAFRLFGRVKDPARA